MIERRDLLGGLGALSVLTPFLAIERAAAAVAKASPPADPHAALMQVPGLKMHGSEKVAMLLYPGFTALDLVGPHYFLACMMGASVDLVTTGPDLSPVASDLKLAIQPTVRLANAPADLDVVFVPGGTQGTVAAMENKAAVDWIRDRGARARHVTSVCTGALLLGKAGLLRGRRATAHWAVRDMLPLFGATPVDARVVTDGRVTTAAGVSAGLDFGIALVAALRGAPYAQALMLQAEYAPEPPLDGGTLATTPAAVGGPMTTMFEAFRASVRRAAR